MGVGSVPLAIAREETLMRLTRTRIWIVGGAAAVAFGLFPAASQAATTIGQSPPTAGTPQPDCTSGGALTDIVQLSNTSGNSYVVPAGGGVITSWRTSTGMGSAAMKLRLFRGNASAVTPVAESATETLTASTGTFLARISVSGGELLGYAINTTANTSQCLNTGAAGGDVIGIASAGPIGQSEMVANGPTVLANVSANLEPDADKDGFGDETQDLCPTQAGTQGPCVQCKGQNATIVGTNLPDAIVGTTGNDVIALLGGADTAKAKAGNDIVCGGGGNDDLKGQTGKDKLFGDRGKDELNGGGGKGDLCNGGKGSDEAKGSCEKERSI
jgi:hemolysin type calcium-binding protein